MLSSLGHAEKDRFSLFHTALVLVHDEYGSVLSSLGQAEYVCLSLFQSVGGSKLNHCLSSLQAHSVPSPTVVPTGILHHCLLDDDQAFVSVSTSSIFIYEPLLLYLLDRGSDPADS